MRIRGTIKTHWTEPAPDYDVDLEVTLGHKEKRELLAILFTTGYVAARSYAPTPKAATEELVRIETSLIEMLK